MGKATCENDVLPQKILVLMGIIIYLEVVKLIAMKIKPLIRLLIIL